MDHITQLVGWAVILTFGIGGTIFVLGWVVEKAIRRAQLLVYFFQWYVDRLKRRKNP